ncbi:3'(2'),5'-bisphosphate nucleotidase CysQ [Flavobacteriaceae sp. LMIT009]
MKESFLNIAIRAAFEAGSEIMKIYENSFQVNYKDDKSPLTKADVNANNVILSYLEKTNIPVISEETKQLDYDIRKTWDSCWIVDPLDGTKEFIKKNDEFTVNIAFVEKGDVSFSVIYAPALNLLYYTDSNKKNAYKLPLKSIENFESKLFRDTNKISPNVPQNSLVRVVGSRSHMNEETNNFINDLKGKYDTVEFLSIGSSLKFCMIAEGEADIYPRFAPTMEWDTAAGQAICEAVGLRVTDLSSKVNMIYNRENLRNNYFVVSLNNQSLLMGN